MKSLIAKIKLFFVKKDNDKFSQNQFSKIDKYILDLENEDPEIREYAVFNLSNNSEAIKKLINIYSNYFSDPWHSSLAGRVIGKKIQKDSDNLIGPSTVSMIYGIDASVIICSCQFCGFPNKGILAPPNGRNVAYYSQDNDKGAYSIPVLCDKCGNKFYVAWDQDPF
ncbi:MAG: hypothetical protein WC868_09070 [Bacteroidales bacterium]